MDEVNINKYLSQFNPILIVPVLSAVVGAILVFVFGFKRPNEPRFSSSSSIDSLKKSKRKANTVKNTENAVQTKQQSVSSAKVSSSKKASEASAVASGKKDSKQQSGGSSSSNNSNSSSNNNNNNNINKKKTEEKKSENGSPAKKLANKKSVKAEPAAPTGKKSKNNKNAASDEHEKPADFDDGGWFTVQSKSAKQKKDKVDDGNQVENASPKAQATKNQKASAKAAKAEAKQQPQPAPVVASELSKAAENVAVEPSSVEQPKANENVIEAVAAPVVVVDEPIVSVSAPEIEVTVSPPPAVVEKKAAAVPVSVAPVATVEVNAVTDNAIAFDELGEWTDAKPDRKRGNKKKSRKD